MDTKDVLECTAHAAEVLIAAIAVSPFIHRAMYLIRTAPVTDEKAMERFKRHRHLRAKMGWGERAWDSFLTWARTYREEPLSWKQRRARHFWCPLLGHHGPDRCEVFDRSYRLDCEQCGAELKELDYDALTRSKRSGKVQWTAAVNKVRWRTESPEQKYPAGPIG